MLTRLDHIQLAMPPDQEATARAFYVDLLGLTEVAKPAPLVPRGGCWFEGQGIGLHLGVQADFIPARKAHPAFCVTDLGELKVRLEGAGYEIVVDDTLPEVARFYAADPFGNRIEFIQDGQGFSQDR